jgi:hypothetical protein
MAEFDVDGIEKEVERWFRDQGCDTKRKRYEKLPELLGRYFPIAIESPTIRGYLRYLWHCRARGEPAPGDVADRVLPPQGRRRGRGRKPDLAFQREEAEETALQYETLRGEFEAERETYRAEGGKRTPKQRAAAKLRDVDETLDGPVDGAVRWLDEMLSKARKSRRASRRARDSRLLAHIRKKSEPQD